MSDMRDLASALDERIWELGSVGMDLRYVLEDAILSALTSVYEEMRANSESDDFDIPTATSEIHMLKADLRGCKLRLAQSDETIRKLEENVASLTASREQLNIDLAASQQQAESLSASLEAAEANAASSGKNLLKSGVRGKR